MGQAVQPREMLDAQEKTSTTILTNANGVPWTQSGLRQKLQKWAKERGYHVVPHGLRKNAVEQLFLAGCTAAEPSEAAAMTARDFLLLTKLRYQSRVLLRRYRAKGWPR